MPSLFARAARAASRTNDRVYGEGFTLEVREAPVAASGLPDVNARRITGPLPPLAFVGVYVERGDLMNARGRAMADSSSHQIASGHPVIDVAADAFAALNAPPEKGWIVTRDDTGERFRISDVLPVDFGRLALHVTAVR